MAEKLDEFQVVYLDSKKQRQESEFHRYRVQHALHKSEFDGSMILVPLPRDEPIRILDSATGEGIWMIEEAVHYPNATFVGIDIEPAGFQQHRNLPEAVSFRQHSVLDEWPASDKGAYDLVHQRYGLANVPADSCQFVVKKLLELVKPGGYIQLVDCDMLSFEREGHPGMSAMMDFIGPFFQMGGMNPSSGLQLEAWLKAAGAEDVQVREMAFQMGKRAKTVQLQEMSAWNQLTLIDNFSFVCEKIPGFWYTPEQFKELAQAVKTEMEEEGNAWRFWVVTGRRKAE